MAKTMNQPNTLILFNPSAGKGRAVRKKEQLENLLNRMNVPHDLVITRSEEHLKAEAERAAHKYKRIVAAGGDSTFHLAANEILQAGADVEMGMIGIGSSNDLAREFGLQGLEAACTALKRGHAKGIDAGCIEKGGIVLRHFLGQANIGLGVEVNRYVEKLAARHPVWGRRQMLAGMAGIRHAFRSKSIPVFLKIASETGRLEGRFHVALFSNIRFWATGLAMCPDARSDDGRLDACFIPACSFGRLVRFACLARKGRPLEKAGAVKMQAQVFRIESDGDFSIQTDGEILGGYDRPDRFRTVTFKVVPAALKLIC